MELLCTIPGPPTMPDGRPLPCFFGRRFLSAAEIIETGLVRNHVTLRRLIEEGQFRARSNSAVACDCGTRSNWRSSWSGSLPRVKRSRRLGRPPGEDVVGGDDDADNNTLAAVVGRYEPEGGSNASSTYD